jgi:predicted ATP-grasp superfamily ATP-dependent carboligase
VDAALAIAERHRVHVVYPGTEAAIAAILPHWARFGNSSVLPYAGAESLRAIRDKRLLPGAAHSVGLRTPVTFMECTGAELMSQPVPIPCIVKPADPATQPGGTHAISSREDLEHLLHSRGIAPERPLVVQEWVRGPIVSVELVLSRDGELVQRFQQIASRTWPTAAGSISLATSVPADQQLVDRGAEMLRQVGYWGLAQLDFVQGVGEPVLIDVNPRFYSCLPLALACGVNLPAAWHEVALGRSQAAPSDYRTGVTFRWLEGDLIAALRGEHARLRGAGRRRSVGAMWARDDPRASAVLGIGAIAVRAGRVLQIPRDRE